MPEPITTSLITSLLRDLNLAFPSSRGKSTEGLVDVYRSGLAGLSGDALRWAVKTAIQEDQYFPKISRLRELANRWQKANRAEYEASIERPSGWCEQCHTVARPETRWRPQVGPPKGEYVRDEKGRIALVQFERLRCACDAPPSYEPDDDGTDYMTDKMWRSPALPIPKPSGA